MEIYTIPPIYNEKSNALILGSFPSVKSREQAFYYAHPQNRFWRVMARIYDESIPTTNDERTALILRHKLALWDVIHSCELSGSSDSTIKNAVPNDIEMIMEASDIQQIYVNGRKAEALYIKHIEGATGIKAIYLPSTSPANAGWSEERLAEFWSKIARR